MKPSVGQPLPFYLFLIATCVLILRPAELLGGWEGLPLYEFSIVGAFALALPQMLKELRWQSLKQRPVDVCILGVFASVLLSHASHFYIGGVIDSGILFVKILIYYFVLITLITTPRRLRAYLTTVVISATVTVGLCVVDFVGMVDIPTIQHYSDWDGLDDIGASQRILRMRGTGIFQDPNDLAMFLIANAVFGIYLMTDRRSGNLRWLWSIAPCVCAVGLACTHSRGGLLAAAATTFAYAWCSGRRGLAMGMAMSGLIALPFVAGRQLDFNLSEGTGHERILLWREGFEALKSPDALFGIGQGMYSDLAGLVAHNSFIHAYVELGLVGGTFFFGCFFFAGLSLWRLAKSPPRNAVGDLDRLRPFVSAALVGWCVGMMSLSRCYVVPTYMIAGVVASYLNLLPPRVRQSPLLPQWNRPTAIQLAMSSGTFFVSLFFAVVVLSR